LDNYRALGNAEAYYKAGIFASFASYSIPVKGPLTVYFLRQAPASAPTILILLMLTWKIITARTR
jgi:hypothetical protein